jgi:hypothetical protein
MKRSLFMLLAILLFVTPPVYASNLIDYTLTSDHETVPCVRDLPAPRDTFDAQEHKEFYAIVVLDTVSVGDTLQFEWFFEGELYSAGEEYVFTEASRYSICKGEGFEIPGTERENMTGLWSVKISIDGVYRLNYPFYLEGLTDPVNTSTTTTKQSAGPCALSVIYGEQSDKTELLRYIRDNALSKTPEGRELIKLYYQWSPLIVKIMEGDENFKEEIKGVIDEVLPICMGTVD